MDGRQTAESSVPGGGDDRWDISARSPSTTAIIAAMSSGSRAEGPSDKSGAYPFRRPCARAPLRVGLRSGAKLPGHKAVCCTSLVVPKRNNRATLRALLLRTQPKFVRPTTQPAGSMRRPMIDLPAVHQKTVTLNARVGVSLKTYIAGPTVEVSE